MGVVSDEKLLDLLELAMSSKAEETVKRSRELIDSGVDPIVLVSQLAGLMMDIIAGTYQLAHSQYENVVLGGRSCKHISGVNVLCFEPFFFFFF